MDFEVGFLPFLNKNIEDGFSTQKNNSLDNGYLLYLQDDSRY